MSDRDVQRDDVVLLFELSGVSRERLDATMRQVYGYGLDKATVGDLKELRAGWAAKLAGMSTADAAKVGVRHRRT